MKRFLTVVVATAVLFTMSFDFGISTPSFSATATAPTGTQPQKTVVKPVIPNKTFTLEAVAKMNGKKGNKAYVIYKGIVYDVTKVTEFKTGTYKNMKVGTDITKVLSKLPKSDALIKKFVAVGKLATATKPPVAPVKPPVATTTAPPTTTTPPATTTVPPATTTKPGELSLTLDELAKFNGKDGKPAYVAVDGIIYDVSALGEWSSGKHFGGIEAGKDLSIAILSSPHGKSILSRAVKVGTLK